MSELVLVRHGQTVWHTDNRYAGRSEVDLTDLGRHQAKVLGGWAAGAGLSAVVASTMQRAIDTATPAAAAAGVELVTDPRLVELDLGRGEGMTRTEMRGVFPDAVAAFVRAPASHPYPGGELGADAVARAMPALTDLAAGEPDAHHRFAYWLDKRGRSSEAEQMYRDAIAAGAPNSQDELAMWLAIQGRNNEAEDAYRTAVVAGDTYARAPGTLV